MMMDLRDRESWVLHWKSWPQKWVEKESGGGGRLQIKSGQNANFLKFAGSKQQQQQQLFQSLTHGIFNKSTNEDFPEEKANPSPRRSETISPQFSSFFFFFQLFPHEKLTEQLLIPALPFGLQYYVNVKYLFLRRPH